MGNTLTKRIILTQFIQGPEGKKSGHWFIGLRSRTRDGRQDLRNLTPERWGYSGLLCEEDEIVAERILDAIAAKNLLEGDDRKQKALDLLMAAGDEGIALELAPQKWEKLETVSITQKIDREISLPLLER